jgi:hypothetical protein
MEQTKPKRNPPRESIVDNLPLNEVPAGYWFAWQESRGWGVVHSNAARSRHQVPDLAGTGGPMGVKR